MLLSLPDELDAELRSESLLRKQRRSSGDSLHGFSPAHTPRLESSVSMRSLVCRCLGQRTVTLETNEQAVTNHVRPLQIKTLGELVKGGIPVLGTPCLLASETNVRSAQYMFLYCKETTTR